MTLISSEQQQNLVQKQRVEGRLIDILYPKIEFTTRIQLNDQLIYQLCLKLSILLYLFDLNSNKNCYLNNINLTLEEMNFQQYLLDFQPIDNTFSLKRIANSSSPTVTVDFEPIAVTNQTGFETSVFKAYPLFNNDHNYFTPGFMLHQDMVRVPKNLSTFLSLHQGKANEMSEQKQQILLPKPSKTNTFCSICKIHYEDYLEHAALPSHMTYLKKNRFIKDINKLCEKFNKKIVKRGRPAKNSKKNVEILSVPLEKNIEEVISVQTCCELEEKS